ncbi:MAG: preprotein translocase subunit SecE [Dehalococcoidia bacterium]
MARNTARTTPGVSRRPRFSVIPFFGEVFSELRKVNWPTRPEATRLTVLVIAISATIGAILGLVDMLFSRLFSILAGT